MKEIQRTVERVVQEAKTIYVADDGKEFTNMNDCLNYEIYNKREALPSRKDIVYLELNAPCDGGYYYTEDHIFLWVKPLTEEAIKAIEEAYKGEYFHVNDLKVGEWTCIEDYNDEWTETKSMASIIDAIQFQFNSLGYDVTFKKRNKK